MLRSIRSKSFPSRKWQALAMILLATHLAQPLVRVRWWPEPLDVDQEIFWASHRNFDQVLKWPLWHTVESEEIARGLAALRKRFQDIDPMIARGEKNLAWAELCDLWVAQGVLAIHNDLVGDAAASRDRCLRGRSGLPAELRRRVDDDPYLRGLLEGGDEAWRSRHWMAAKEQFDKYFDSVKLTIYAQSNEDALSKWLQADALGEIRRLLEIERTQTSQLRVQNAAVAALTRDLETMRREGVDLKAGLDSAAKRVCEVETSARAKDQELAVKQGELRAVLTALADLRVRYDAADKGLDHIRSLLKAAQQDAQTKGRTLLAVGDELQALRNEVAGMRSRLVEAAYRRGKHWMGQKQFTAGLACFDIVIELEPGHDDAYNNRGEAYYGLKRYAAAKADFEKAIKLRPEDADYPYSYISIIGLLLYCPDVEFRDAQRAVVLARKVCDLTSWNNPDACRLFAAACQEAARHPAEQPSRTARNPFGLGVRQINPNGYNPFIRK